VAFGDIFNPLLAAIKRALGPFGKLFDLLSKFWTRITRLWTNLNKLVTSITTEIQEWKRFKEDIRYRTRVISIPAAVEKTRAFIEQIVAARDAIFDLWDILKSKFEGTANPTEEAEQAIKDIEASGLHDILSKFPRLLKGAEKVLGFISIVADALESILDAIDDLQRIVDVLKSIREEVEHGSTVFLSQSNKRRTLKLADGGSIKIRVGNLH
jgi:phage-related minor tail protein